MTTMSVEGILGLSLRQTALALSLFMSVTCGVASDCAFKQKWQGRWYQSRLGDITIRPNAISTKGTCKETHRDFYLLQNKQRNCNVCLIIIQRHRNVLQYRESFCLPYNTLREVCDQIKVEAPLYTLVREGSEPVECPFQEAFNFIYSNNTNSFCRSPQSYIKPCASSAKFNFRFRHCNDIPDTNERIVNFECLATWKDGSSMYMYGGFSGNGVLNQDDMYRCFMYQSLGSEMHLSMSADASCQGLRSPSDGPLVMELTRDTKGWKEPTCEFPDWLRKSRWRDLSGKNVYDTDPSGRVLEVRYHRHPRGRGHTSYTFRCSSILIYEAEVFIAISFTSHGCNSYQHCIKIRRLHHNVIQISQGPAHDNNFASCSNNEVNKTRELLIPEDITQSPCPYHGMFEEKTTSTTACSTQLQSGCNGTGVMNVKNTCFSEKATTLECLSHWEENKKKYVIARKVDDENKLANCFAFDEDEHGMKFNTDLYCNAGTKHAFDEAVEYSLRKVQAPCGDEAEGYGLTGNAPVLAPSTLLIFVLSRAFYIFWIR